MNTELFKQITQRVLEFTQEEGMRDLDLANALGIKRQNITPMKNNESYISANRLIPFLLEQRARLNILWVLTGEGDMLANPMDNANMKVDRKGNITFRGAPSKEVAQVENQRLCELLESKERHIESLNELVKVYKALAEGNKPNGI